MADRAFVRDALLWLSYSCRPMKLEELCEAVVVEDDDTTIDESCRINPKHRLVELCRGLIEWDRITGVVALAHSSIRTYLTSEEIRISKCAGFALDDEDASSIIIRKCITYLLMKDFKLTYRDASSIRQLQKSFPLLDYASIMWTEHAKRFQRKMGRKDLDLIETLMFTHRPNTGGSNFSFWINCLIPQSGAEVIRDAEPLYYLCSFGLEVCVERLFQHDVINTNDPHKPWYIDKKSGRNASTALQVACVRGTARTVEMLLRAGPDPDSTDRGGFSCLWFATRRRRANIISLLRQYNATSHGLYSSKTNAGVVSR